MKVLFLDIDGVLNCRDSFASEGASFVVGRHRGQRVEPAMIERLNRIIEATGAQIVISSCWRLGDAGKVVAGWLEDGGFRHADAVISETPWMPTIRGIEIGAWLAKHPEVATFAIVDDDADMGSHLHRLVQTSFERGLQDDEADRLIAMLSEAA